jgi:hypothetical protein
MSEPIRAKVARILNSREIAITAGSANGVVTGMYFDVMDPKGEDIRDPDTDEILGSIERPKVRVQVTKVQDRLSVASTYRKTKENIGGKISDFGSLSQILMPPKWVTKYETLKTEEKTWEDLEEEKSYVKIGDPVVQVIDEVDVGDDDKVS